MEYKDTKSINVKTCGQNPKDAIKTGAPVPMARIYGVIQDCKTVENRKNGEMQTVFIGEFRAEFRETGYQSEKMYLFRALEEKLKGVFTSGGQKPVEFAYDVAAEPNDKNAYGYSYTAKSLIATAASDRLNAISALIAPDETAAAPAAPESKGASKRK